jgi:formyl-CoA transferase
MGGFPSYDAMVQAWAGFNSVTGNQRGGPVHLGLPMVDLGTGLNLAVGILMALVERHRSGKGQFLELTLYDAAVALRHPRATNWFHGGMTSELVCNAHQTLAPYDQFDTRGRNIVTGAGNDPQFRRLCAVIGRPELANDLRFRTNEDRSANRIALVAVINEAVSDRDGEELALELMRSGVPAGVVQSLPDVLSHPCAGGRRELAADRPMRLRGIVCGRDHRRWCGARALSCEGSGVRSPGHQHGMAQSARSAPPDGRQDKKSDREDDLLDTFCYGIALALGDQEGL